MTKVYHNSSNLKWKGVKKNSSGLNCHRAVSYTILVHTNEMSRSQSPRKVQTLTFKLKKEVSNQLQMKANHKVWKSYNLERVNFQNLKHVIKTQKGPKLQAKIIVHDKTH